MVIVLVWYQTNLILLELSIQLKQIDKNISRSSTIGVKRFLYIETCLISQGLRNMFFDVFSTTMSSIDIV